MKPSSFLLTVSIAANLALGGWLLLAAVKNPEDVASTPVDDVHATLRTTADRLPANMGPTGGSPLWQQLDATYDFKTLIVRLRAAGFPPDVIRAMVTSLVAMQFDAERSKIDADARHTPYWKKWPNSFFDPKVGPALRKLEQQQKNLLKELLGDAGSDPNPEETAAWRELGWGKLSPEKLDRLMAKAREYDEKRMAFFATATGGRSTLTMLPEDRAKLAELDRAQRSDLAEFLTPAEMEDYDLRSGSAANQLKWMLGPFRATEAEYRAIFPLYQEYLDHFPTGNLPAPGTADPARAAALETLLAQAAARIGPERAEALRLVFDSKLANLNRLVSRLDLPLSAAKQVYEVQQDVQQRAATLRAAPGLEADQRAAQLSALQKEAIDKLTQTLGGARGIEAYREYGGQWLSSLTPPKGG